MVDVALSSGKESGVRVVKLAPRWFISNSTKQTLLLQPFFSSRVLGSEESFLSVSSGSHSTEGYIKCSPGGLQAVPVPISCWAVDESLSKPLVLDLVLNIRVKLLNEEGFSHADWSILTLGTESSLKDSAGVGGIRRHVVVGSQLLTVACTRSESGDASYLAFGVDANPPVVVHNLFAKHSFRFAFG